VGGTVGGTVGGISLAGRDLVQAGRQAGGVPPSRTHCEPIHGRSLRNFLFRTVLRGGTPPTLLHFASFNICRFDYVQNKVRPGTGREGVLGYEPYFAGEHMDVRCEAPQSRT